MMNEINAEREKIATFAKSMYQRGLTSGSTGNISSRLSDGTLLVTPTGRSFGFLDPAQISHLDQDGTLLSGDAPTKEMPLHSAFYTTRSNTGAVVHLHSTHSVALSVLPDTDPEDVLPHLTAYGIMKLGRVKLLPYFMPGDPAMGQAVEGLAGKRSAVLLAHHGPVVAGRDLEAAVYATEELEEGAKLALLTRGLQPNQLSATQIMGLIKHFKVDW